MPLPTVSTAVSSGALATTRIWTAASAAALAVLLAGCGGTPGSSATAGSAPTATSPTGHPAAMNISTGMQLAVKKAASVHITGTWGKGSRRRDIDVTANRAGDVAGTVTSGHDRIAVAAYRNQPYITISPGFLAWDNLPSGICAKYCGKYIKGPVAPFRKQFGDWRMSHLLGPFTNTLLSAHYAGSVTVGGQAAWVLRDPGDKSAGDPAYTLYVAAHGTPYLLRLKASQLDLKFTQWDRAAVPPHPPASTVVEVSQLTQG